MKETTQRIVPWTGNRLMRLTHDLAEVTDLGWVGPEGRAILEKARQYIIDLGLKVTGESYAEELKKSRARVDARRREAKRHV
jgi:hypothetical protein